VAQGAPNAWVQFVPAMRTALGTRSDGTLWIFGQHGGPAGAQFGTATDWGKGFVNNTVSGGALFALKGTGEAWKLDATNLTATRVGSGSDWYSLAVGSSTTLFLGLSSVMMDPGTGLVALPAPLTARAVAHVAASGSSLSVTVTSAEVYSWGANATGQLGVADFVTHAAPTLLAQ
jgi:hypothetical protein